MDVPVRRVLIAALAAVAITACGDGGGDDQPATADANTDPSDARTLAGPVVEIQTTLGTLVVSLAEEEMPVTTANFLAYVDAGFYDGTIVHRVIDDWVIQGGGYTSGLAPKNGNPPINLETHPDISHVHGAISMARTPDPNSATSQWFICDWPKSGTPPQPGALDGEYAAFGVLIEGFDVLEAITQVATQSSGGLDDVPIAEIVVTSATRR